MLASAEFQLNAHKLKISNNSGTRGPQTKRCQARKAIKKEEHTERKFELIHSFPVQNVYENESFMNNVFRKFRLHCEGFAQLRFGF